MTPYNVYYNLRGTTSKVECESIDSACVVARSILISGGEITSIINAEED